MKSTLWKANLVIVILALTIQCGDGAKILFFFGVSSYGHRIGVWPLVEALAEKGHEVTFFSPHKPKERHPKVKEFGPDEIDNFLSKLGFSNMNPLSLRIKEGAVKSTEMAWEGTLKAGIKLCQLLVAEKSVQAWLKTEKFDLVVLNSLFNECGLGFAHKFSAAVIDYSPTSPFMWWPDKYGYLDEASIYPSINVAESNLKNPNEIMSFRERFGNTFRTLYWHHQRTKHFLPEVESILRNGVEGLENMPALVDLEKEAALVLIQGHFALEFPRALPPFIKQVGGMHISKKNTTLSQEMKNFIEGHKVVYMSFGSMADSGALPDGMKKIFFDSFSNFPKIRFLVKMKGLGSSVKVPKNVKIYDWFPQQQILAHPSVKAFISHGGLMGMLEAVNAAVPTIIFPIFAEQYYHGLVAQTTGRGILLDFNTVSESVLTSSIQEILKNKKFAENAARISKIFRNRLVDPVDEAVWWIENSMANNFTLFKNYLLNEKLCSPYGSRLHWFQRRSLDVWLAVLLAFYVVTKAMIKVTQIVFSKILSSPKVKDE